MTGKKLIVMCGLRRSGNHYLRDWIEYQFPKPTHNMYNYGLDFYLGTLKGYQTEKVNCRVVSIEEYPPQAVLVPDKYGHDEIKRIVLLRDPYNLFASRMKWYTHDDDRYFNPKFITYLWVDYAKFVLSKPENVIIVLYNKFFSDAGYRRELSDKLDGRFDDTPINFINSKSGGSSFDGTAFLGSAQNMKVLERWKVYKNNKNYRSLFTDEIKDLSNQIFGFNPL